MTKFITLVFLAALIVLVIVSVGMGAQYEGDTETACSKNGGTVKTKNPGLYFCNDGSVRWRGNNE